MLLYVAVVFRYGSDFGMLGDEVGLMLHDKKYPILYQRNALAPRCHRKV